MFVKPEGKERRVCMTISFDPCLGAISKDRDLGAKIAIDSVLAAHSVSRTFMVEKRSRRPPTSAAPMECRFSLACGMMLRRARVWLGSWGE
jgi:hypothetical protein